MGVPVHLHGYAFQLPPSTAPETPAKRSNPEHIPEEPRPGAPTARETPRPPTMLRKKMAIPGALSRILPHPAGYKYYKFQTGSREKKIAAPRDRGRVQNACAGMKGDVNRVRLNTREDRAAIGSRSKKNEKKKFQKIFFANSEHTPEEPRPRAPQMPHRVSGAKSPFSGG